MNNSPFKPQANEFQPNLEDSMHGDGVSDREIQPNPSLKAPRPSLKTLAYGSPVSMKQMLYGGVDDLARLRAQVATLASRVYRSERGVPFVRRGVLIPAIPRTKAETIYVNDPGQALQNKVLNTGASGTGTSGIPTPGTVNKPNATTGAINRYRTTYKTNLQ